MQITKDDIDTFLGKKGELFKPFDETLIAFCDDLSKALFEVRQFPDLTALAFWLRKGHIQQLKEIFDRKEMEGVLRVPRGLAFHIPPSNVDTMFVYSWVISLLVGNCNLVRVPSKKTESSEKLFYVLMMVLSQYEKIQEQNAFIVYGHEEEVTAKISACADVRVIWGGDRTIQTIRQIPLKPTAKEIVFADRYSFSVIHSGKYLQASEDQKKELAKQFFNDIYWFDQAACSSPRTVFWVDHTAEASDTFYRLLTDEIQSRQFEIPLGGYLDKTTFAFSQVLQHPVHSVKTLCNELTVIHLDQMHRDHCGRGLLFHVNLDGLETLIPHIKQKDQTMTYFGFSKEELGRFVQQLNGKGVDRVVPIGKALEFDVVWDGYDLFQELVRFIKY